MACSSRAYHLLIEQSRAPSYCCSQQASEMVIVPHIYHTLITSREMLFAQHEKSLELHPQ